MGRWNAKIWKQTFTLTRSKPLKWQPRNLFMVQIWPISTCSLIPNFSIFRIIRLNPRSLSKSFYIISSVMHAFWLVLADDLLEERPIDDDSAPFKFDSCVILWTNHNSLLSIATNQFASFCLDNRVRQSATVFLCLSKWQNLK